MNNKFNLVYRVGQSQNKKNIFIRHSIYGYEIVSRSDGKDTLIHDFKSQSQAIDSFSLMLRMNQDNNIPCYIDVEMTREIFKDESPFLIYRLNQTATVQVTTMYGELPHPVKGYGFD